ncbi:MAG TPA: 5-carboxymethyl-2-hydroxymuconate Delta-isomerase [Hyphomicrobiaceae bacterium]|nr:5-carboxymethyl-2-hydroxymuconate Delta-isomerase [Hyphomicrobiaceae bacterium]
MPHIIVDYSANLDARLDIPQLLEKLHTAALETGVFPVGGLRTRAARRDAYVVADRHSDNAYVHVQLRIGTGRTPDVRQKAAEHVFAALKSATAADMTKHPLGLTLEVVEIDPVGALRHNNLHDYVATRSKS